LHGPHRVARFLSPRVPSKTLSLAMFYRLTLLVGVSHVAGFASTPGEATLAARSTYKGASLCEANSYELCLNSGAYSAPRNVRMKRKKNCFIGGWCYFREGEFNMCEYFRAGCETPGSSDCQSYENMVRNLQCPAVEEAGESTFCTTALATRTEVASCGAVSKDTCTESYTKTVDHGVISFPNNGARLSRDYKNAPAYQACEWSDATSSCGPAKDSSGAYDAMTFCGDYCEIMGSEDMSQKQNLKSEDKTSGVFTPLKCNQGRLDRNPAQFPFGLPSRLSNRAACVASYFEIGSDGVYQGCEWLGPTDPTDYYSSNDRCKPSFYCSPSTIAAGQCNPACNCMAMQGTACAPAQIMCCSGATCNVCADIEKEVDGNTYAAWVAPERR